MSYMRADSSWSQPRDFNGVVQICSSNIQKISQNSGQIKNLLYQQGTRQETSEVQEKLQQLQHYTNQIAKETNRHLKELSSLPPALSPSEQRQQKLQKERLMNDFSAALNNFQVVQRRAAEKEKESMARARAGSRVTGDGGSVNEELVTFEKEDEWNQRQIQTEEPSTITEEDLEIIKERETNIKQLEADIMDVNQIFKDLAVMIHDQGEMIDSIEANVENAEVHVDRGVVQLQKAAYYQRKSRKRMCMLAMVGSLVLIILIIIIWQAIK
ncbi:syntaxin-12-like [Mugil cephalus]|uniref:syntaxin-12-like n=1 Tax=Mugil cephalus TaxID=48193 RepID=UPI001FB66A88|nr:syntaxin-12-like [Mugil cephalus]XP_047455799.1 syntaxin-12-like [Mugil cephalus]